MGIFLSARRACRTLDRYESSKDQGVDLKKFQKIANRASRSCLVSRAVKKALNGRVQALAYRQGKAHAEPGDMQAILRRAEEWKGRQTGFNNQKELTAEDKDQLTALLGYKDYLPYVHWDKFFRWSLLNRQSVDVFVQFPHVVDRLSRSLLSSRIGVFGGLKYTENEGKKDVELPFGDKHVSILNGKERITYASGFTKRIDKIFKSFGKKNFVEGSFTYLKEEGAVAWDSFAMGYLDKYGNPQVIDLNLKDWHKQLPLLEKNISAEEAKRRFGVNCDGKNWVITLVCKTSATNLDAFGSHSYVRLLIPNGDGTYDYTYGWGTYSEKYPQNFLHGLTFLFCPKKGTLQYPDNNEIYTHRDTLERHFLMTPENGKACLASFLKDLKKARKGKFTFQLLIKNCSDWGVKKIKKYAVNGENESHLMDIQYTDLKPKGIFGVIMKILRAVPDCFRRAFLYTVAVILGGWKKRGKVSVLDTPPWDKKRHFHHPGKVFQDQRKMNMG